jgi:glycosyltransferase involved in cell wall biosynthesis
LTESTVQQKPLIVACIPAYNEEKTIAKVVLLAQKHVGKVIVCDDGSVDMTGEIAKSLGAEVIRHEKNFGYGAAIQSLFRSAKELGADIMVTLDADGQHDAGEISSLIQPIVESKADMVVGSRYLNGSRGEIPLYRRLGLKLIDTLGRRGSKSLVRDTQCGFRAYSGKALNAMLLCESNGYEVDMEQLKIAAENGLGVAEVPVCVRYKGLEKTSKKNPLRHGSGLVGTALRLIVEERPLLLLGIPGALLVVFGIAMGAYLLWDFNAGRYFSVPIALITLGALFMGALLFITSIMLYAIGRLGNRK